MSEEKNTTEKWLYKLQDNPIIAFIIIIFVVISSCLSFCNDALDFTDNITPKTSTEIPQNNSSQEKTSTKDKESPVNITSKIPTKTELPLQTNNKPLSIILKKRTKGFIKVLHEGRKVNFLPNSNKYNIRIAIEDLPISGNLIIITALKDTCYLSLPITNIEKIDRIFPQCL